MASVRDCMAMIDWVMTSTRRLGNRSASAPPEQRQHRQREELKDSNQTQGQRRVGRLQNELCLSHA